MILGTAAWPEGVGERQALVARLASGRVADLNRIEAVRLRKLGEGDADRLAEVLVPTSLRRVLEGGPRALARVRQAVAYAEKWDRRGTLPEELAPPFEQLRLLPCLPVPSVLRDLGGLLLDRHGLRGHGATLAGGPQPTLAVLGQAGGLPGGTCLALQDALGVVLGTWMTDAWPTGSLELRAGGSRRSVPIRAYEDLALAPLRPGEVRLLPPPRLRALPVLPALAEVRLEAGFDTLLGLAGPEGLHPTVQ